MDLTANQQSPQLIEPPHHNRRRFLAVSAIFVVIISLLVSIFTQPFLGPQESLPLIHQAQDDYQQDVQKTTQQGGNITSGLVWVGQITISFIALLSSIAELTGVSIRELFGSRAAKTSVEEFPFYVFQDYEKVLDYLFPDPRTPLLPDRSITYLPQISTEADDAFQSKGMILVSGKSKTGKTREACELLRRWWFSGPTVLVVRSHVGLYPPFKIPEDLPLRNLIIFFDDIDRYLGDPLSLKRLEETLLFFQKICHNRGELRVIATARQEEEFWERLRYDPGQAPWNNFELIQMPPLSSEKALEVIFGLSAATGVSVEPDLAKVIAEKNNGTFLNLVLAFRSWLNQNVQKLTSAQVRSFEGSLVNTWRHRYEELVKLRPGVKPIYAAINFMQSQNISLDPALIGEFATEMGMHRRALSVLGLIDRLQNWVVMSPAFNWYRDPKRRRAGWLAILITALFLGYISLAAILSSTPVATQLEFFDQLSTSLRFQFLCLSPLWMILIPIAFLWSARVWRSLAFRQTNHHLEFLLKNEIPLRGQELRPYENQFEGNGETKNWPLSSYAGEDTHKRLPRNVSYRLISRYLSMAERLRSNGEFTSARRFASLAQQISPDHPAPPFMLGKIELDDENYHDAIALLNESRKLYGNSANKSHADERLALCRLCLEEYERAEELAEEALKGISDLGSARWVLGLAQIKLGKTQPGRENCNQAAKGSIPVEIQRAVVKIGLDSQPWFKNGHSTIALPKKGHPSRRRNIRNLFVFSLSLAVVAVLFVAFIDYVKSGFHQEESESRLRLSNLLVAIFPDAPLVYINRATDYSGLGDLEKAVADYTEAVRLSPEATIYNSRGNLYLDLGENDKALADYNQATVLEPDYVHPYNNRGLVYDRRGELENALVEYSRAIGLDPEYALAYVNRGGVYQRLGDHENAIADYTAAIQIDPDYAYAYARRGDNYVDRQEYEQAIADYSEAIRIVPDYAYAYVSRGGVYERLEDDQQAIADYSEAIRIVPDYAYAYIRRGEVYERLGDGQQAIIEYSEAIRIDPAYVTAYYIRGNIYFNRQEYEKAIADYTEAIQILPENGYAYYNRGNIYYRSGDYQKAIADYTESIRLAPQAYAYNYRGEIYDRLGDHEHAIADYTEAIRLNPIFADYCGNISCLTAAIGLNSKSALMYKRRADFYQTAGEFENAVADYAEALRLDPSLAGQCTGAPCFTAVIDLNPTSAQAYKNRGYAFDALGESEKAIADYTEAIRLDPSLGEQCFNPSCYTALINSYEDPADAKAYLLRGHAYHQLGKYDQAIADYAEAIRQDPELTDFCPNSSYCAAIINYYAEPEDAQAYTRRGYAYFVSGEYEQALTDLTEAIRLDTALAQAYYYRGNSFVQLNLYEDASSDYTEAIRLDSGWADHCLNLWCYTAAINLDPNNMRALRNRADAYYRLGQYEDAIEDWNEALRIANEQSDAEMLSALLAMIQSWISEEARAGHIERALEWLARLDTSKRAVDANTLNSVCWYGSLWGHARQVLEVCEQAVRLEPDDADIRDSRGLARALAGDLEGAISGFQYFVDNSVDTNAVAQRKLWIPELRKGINPFTPKVLESLK